MVDMFQSMLASVHLSCKPQMNSQANIEQKEPKLFSDNVPG